jgi:hypothetical protein
MNLQVGLGFILHRFITHLHLYHVVGKNLDQLLHVDRFIFIRMTSMANYGGAWRAIEEHMGSCQRHGELRRSMTSFRKAWRAAEDPSQPRTGTRAAPAERAEGAGRAHTTPAQTSSDRSIDLPRHSAWSSDRLIHHTCVCAVMIAYGLFEIMIVYVL